MDGKVARQLLFKKKLEEENRDAEERLRVTLSNEMADKKLRVKRLEKQRLITERNQLVHDLEQANNLYQQLKQEEAIQKIMEIKIQNKKVERANRLIDLTKRLSEEEQNIKLKEAELTNAQYSMKLQRKNYQDIKPQDDEKNQKEIIVTMDEQKNNKKRSRSARRAQRESEERKKFLWEKAEILKRKRADKLKDQFDALRLINEEKKEALEKDKRLIESKDREDKMKLKIDEESITRKLNIVIIKINKLEVSVEYIDLEIQNIEHDIRNANPRKLLKKWVE
eukprot:GFUD01029826.1.p1 GENE.GFUD01029826.1~~GFUD01029826.1.p1  ORF type:complete len:281 (+),score=93.23 GFUD01029826.1:137-979(+)